MATVEERGDVVHLDIEQALSPLRDALPESEPYPALKLFAAQLPHLDDETAVDLLKRLLAAVPPNVWPVDDETLGTWSVPQQEVALEAVRALPPGEARLDRLCRMPSHLSVDEKRDVLDAILDGTLRAARSTLGPKESRWHLFARLAKTLPVEWQEEVDRDEHLSSALLQEGFVTDTYAESIWRTAEQRTCGIPTDLLLLGEQLPTSTKQRVLSTARAWPVEHERPYALSFFTTSLSGAERHRLTAPPTTVADSPYSSLASHLSAVAAHLGYATTSQVGQWHCLLVESGTPTQVWLGTLLPHLSGDVRRRAQEDFDGSVIAEGHLPSDETEWSLLSDAVFAHLLPKLWDENAMDFVAAAMHVSSTRSLEACETCFGDWVRHLAALPSTRCVELVWATTAWLLKASSGQFSSAVAALTVPKFESPVTPHYDLIAGFRDVFAEASRRPSASTTKD